MSRLKKQKFSSLETAMDLTRSSAQPPHSYYSKCSSAKGYSSVVEVPMEPPSGPLPDIPTAFEATDLRRAPPMRLAKIHPHHEESAPPVPDETRFSRSKDGARNDTLKKKIRHAWIVRKNPQVDPDFAHLPRGLNKRIKANKDPFRDKLHRLRRRKKEVARPIPLYELPQQCPEPIYWPAPNIDRYPPRCAPPITPQLVFDNPGPAFDRDQNPLGGEHSILYEEEAVRDQRNQATQQALKDRAISDRLLAFRGQGHIRNSIIGRAPPLSRRYIEEEVQRLALEPAEEQKTAVAVDPSTLGLPANGARPFQWDHALLQSKSMPDFHDRHQDDHGFGLYSALSADSFTRPPTRRAGLTEIHSSMHHSQGERKEATISASAALIGQWMATAESTAEPSNHIPIRRRYVVADNHGKKNTSRFDKFSDGGSDYGEIADCDDGYHIDHVNNVSYSSEHHAEIYRREIETLDGS